MKRLVLAGIAAVVAVAMVVWLTGFSLAAVKPPIRVGLLHSRTGSMAVSELSMIDAEVLAIEEINAAGGLLGRRVEAVEADGESDPRTFARRAERLIQVEKVSMVIGCWSSACRKAVKPVVERADHLLIYPVAYEGMEQSPQIVYTGASPNQQVIPTVKWCLDELKAKSFFLIGTDTVGPHAINAVIKDQLKALGADLAGEEYVKLDATEVNAAVGRAVKAAPSVILSTLEGDVNAPFYKTLRGDLGSRIPTVTFTMTEDELRSLPVKLMTDDYAACNYFQAIDTPENADFVRRFRARYGAARATCDAVATAYTSVHLWAQAVKEAETDRVPEVRTALVRQSISAPEGIVSIDRDTQHTWRPFFLGKFKPDGSIAIVKALVKAVPPNPFPSSRTREQWEAMVAELWATAGRE